MSLNSVSYAYKTQSQGAKTKVNLLNDVHGVVSDVTHVDGDDVASTCARGEHAENAGAAADVEHDLALKQGALLVHAVAVELGANAVLVQIHVHDNVHVQV